MLKNPPSHQAFNWKLFAILSVVLFLVELAVTSFIESQLDSSITTGRVERAAGYAAFVVPCLAATVAGWRLVDMVPFLAAVFVSSIFYSGWNIGVGFLSLVAGGAIYFVAFRIRQFVIYSRLPDELENDGSQESIATIEESDAEPVDEGQAATAPISEADDSEKSRP